MEFTFNTYTVDATIALRALKNYRAGDFHNAAQDLLNILDHEPRNWQARLMLGACYFKTKQYGAAQRVFRHMCENSSDAELREKAWIGLQTTTDKLTKKTHEMPLEFGDCVVRVEPKTWLSDASWQ